MERKYTMPRGPIVDPSGEPNVPARAYLGGIESISKTLNAGHAVENLDGGTSYTLNELRDKMIELIAALKTE